VILACIVLTVTNVAAFWAWRLAEVSLENARRNGHAEFLRANKAAKEYMTIKDELNLLKINRVNENNMHDAEVAKLRNEKLTMAKNCSELVGRIEGLQNEIDGLNVDKLHLKSELAKYRAIHEKRKAQKAANMRRFRAKQKEAKG
jgi:uncharacterized protein YdcH (DUF465 family)